MHQIILSTRPAERLACDPNILRLPGGYSGTPPLDPISNSTVKRSCADGTTLWPNFNTAFLQVSDLKEKLPKFKMTWHYASGVRGVSYLAGQAIAAVAALFAAPSAAARRPPAGIARLRPGVHRCAPARLYRCAECVSAGAGPDRAAIRAIRERRQPPWRDRRGASA